MDSVRYMCILPVISNFFVIPLFALLLRDWTYLYLEAYYVLAMASVSLVYHMMLATDLAFLGYTVADIRLLDHAFAEGMGGLIIALYFIPKLTQRRHHIEIPLVTFIFVMQFLTQTSWALVLALFTTLVVSRFVPHIIFTYQQLLLIGTGLVATAIAYFYNNHAAYPYTHALWHVFIFLILAGVLWYGRKDIINIQGPINKGSFIFGIQNNSESRTRTTSISRLGLL